ncbi:protein of unknown function [Paraburkholderia kururiensis]
MRWVRQPRNGPATPYPILLLPGTPNLPDSVSHRYRTPVVPMLRPRKFTPALAEGREHDRKSVEEGIRTCGSIGTLGI